MRETSFAREGFGVASGRQDQQTQVRDLRGHVGEEPQRICVGPLQVVEHEQPWLLVGQSLQCAGDAIEYTIAGDVHFPIGRELTFGHQ